MTVFKKFKTTSTTFGELDYGDLFSCNDNKDIIYLKVYDTINSKDLAIIIDDPNEETDGTYNTYQFPRDMTIDQIYSADLYLYD